MIAFKKKYFFIIETINDIDLKKFKKFNKFNIIYRNKNYLENIDKLKKFVQLCRSKHISFFVANNVSLVKIINAHGLYISSHNTKIYHYLLNNKKYKLIGSAHNLSEFNFKKRQGCSEILFSRIFKTDYKNKKDYLGLIKFNLLIKNFGFKLTPLGGIKKDNFRIMSNVNSNGFALSGQIKRDNYFNKILYW